MAEVALVTKRKPRTVPEIQQRVLDELTSSSDPTRRWSNRNCPYCQAGHRRHTARGSGKVHWHTIKVHCWDRRPER